MDAFVVSVFAIWVAMFPFVVSVLSSLPIIVAFVGKAYKVVGDVTMKGFENFVLAYNKNEYLTETYIGGGLGVYGSGAVLKMKTA